MAETKEPTVELIPAFVWDCPECGVEHFQRTIVCEFTPEELVEMRNEHGVDPLKEGLFLTAPTHVKCQGCKSKFKVVHFGDDDEDKDEDE